MADNGTLIELYSTKSYMTTVDIEKTFGVCKETARRAIKYVDAYVREQGVEPYETARDKMVETEMLFKAYGWDIDKIAQRASYGKKGDRK